MLENDPPAGTEVYLVREVKKGLRTLEAYETVRLTKRGGYTVESPDDLFEIESRGEKFTVRRDEIRKR